MQSQPLYLFIKPPPELAREIVCRRELLGIDSDYGWDRLHTTLVPLGDGRAVPTALPDLLDRAIGSLDIGGCAVGFDMLTRNALTGGKTLRDLRALQAALVRRLRTFGLALPDYVFRPHLSVAYGPAPDRRIAVPPIGWQVEELLLIRSIHGEGRHETLARWPLVPRQHAFVF